MDIHRRLLGQQDGATGTEYVFLLVFIALVLIIGAIALNQVLGTATL